MKATKSKRGEAAWSKVISDQEVSGLTQRTYCQREGLALSTFTWWRRRLSKSSTGATPTRFVELVPTAAAEPEWQAGQSASRWDVELDLGDGMTLRMRSRC